MAVTLRRKPQARPVRVLTASARQLDLKNKTEAHQLRALLQGWQSDAWNFRDSIPELRYAVQFKANAMSRMRLFVGVEPEAGESDKPIPLDEATGIPEEVVSIATQALMDLAVDEGQRRTLLRNLSMNIDVAGECRMLGRTDKETGDEEWSVRSTDEIEIRDDGYWMREIPDGPQGIIPWEELDPELDSVSRIWVPHPRFNLMADSPLKAMLQACETLLLLRRMIRAEARSRLNRGILTVPDELSIKVPDDDNEDPEADPFFSNLVKALIEPIGDEGAASAYAPIAVRGPADVLKALQHISLTEPFEEQAMKAREELVGNMATGFDLPREVVEGAADMNHWTAWQVDDNTFRHHLEPHVITGCDALTAGYYRPRLLAQDVPIQYARRLVIWYDPTELVTHPDRTADAEKAHAAFVISDEAYRNAAGFSDADKPSPEELEFRQFQHIRTMPPNLLMEFARRMDPSLVVPPITVAGTIPGIKPGGVDIGPPAAPVPGAPATETPIPAAPTPAEKPASQPSQGPPPITASGAAQSARLSRKLAGIDRDLRAKLQTAANAAMHRQLERAGANLRTKVAKDETLRTKIAHRQNERVSAILGKGALAAAGIDAGVLMDSDWSGLRTQFNDWTEAAQKQAIATAIRMGSLSEEDSAVKAAEAAMDAGRDAGWDALSTALTDLGHHLLYNPDPNVGPGEWADLNPDTLVPTGTIRAALGVAGGGDAGVIPGSESTVALGQPIGQIGTGSTITELLTSSNMEQGSYEWDHGPSLDPFEPHLDLDGVEFDSFDSEALANSTGFPDNAYYFPGDHQGCACDFTPMWVQTEQTVSGEVGEQTSE